MNAAAGTDLEVALVTGMSGAGRSTAARALEDLGWFVIDNLPPSLLQQAVQLARASHDITKMAVVVDDHDALPERLGALRHRQVVDGGFAADGAPFA